ncbi:MAG TPA: ABC transporter permease, partial [Chitinophagaceae bacterium]
GIGIACSLLIFLWVQDERSYDGFHANGDRLYKVLMSFKSKNGDIGFSMDATAGRLAETMKKDLPDVQCASTVIWPNNQVVTVGDKIGKEGVRYADTDFFRMFSFPLLQGNPKTALSSKDNIVITQAMARKYFGQENPMGKTIRLENKKDYRVSGVAADIPLNSSIRFDAMLPLSNAFEENPWMVAGWNHFGPPTYVMLRPGTSKEQFNAKIRNFIVQHDSKVTEWMVSVQPFADTYLYSHYTKSIPDGGRIEYVRLFSIVAIFILLIGCINFMNLATARSIKRAREVGVRKVVGAGKGYLFGQFMAEAMLTTLLAVIIAIVIILLVLPSFNLLTGKQLALHPGSPSFLLTLLGLMLITGFIAGSYPALFLSSLRPVAVLKGPLKFNQGATVFRKGLVVFQFTLSIALIICTVIVYRQMQYVQTKNLGLDRSNIVYMPMQGGVASRYDAFKNELLESGNIESVSRSSAIPTSLGMATDGVAWPGKAPSTRSSFWEMSVDYDFVPTMKIQLKEGRNYSRDFGDDSSNFIFNEEGIKEMNMKHPLGQTITYNGQKGKIIGIVKDFHFRSLHEPIAPLFIHFGSGEGGLGIVKTVAGKTAQAIATLGSVWKKFNPEYPPDYLFSDDVFNQQYESETMVGRLANISAFLAIFISCLGLFGLAMFMAEQRTKEIGIRKVLGAGVTQVIAMLSKDFAILIIVSAVLAFPIAWWAMNKWLEDFHYKIAIGWWVFPLAGLLALFIALCTISFQAIKVATANPVKSLRSE